MRLIRDIEEFRRACAAVRANGGTLGLVPTMGALHAGHMALVNAAAKRATSIAVTIFVNPTQFGPNEDFARYPRTLEQDAEACRAAGVALLFAPSVSDMYPEGEATRVSVDGLSSGLCGASRPGHFEGVATVVTKLFSVAGECSAVFGRKDYQQLKVIERLVRDLLLPVRIVAHPIVREPDGLALSSRNQYLSPEERQSARAIPLALSAVARRFAEGERTASTLKALARARLEQSALRVDYVELADAETLLTPDDRVELQPPVLLAIAAHAGRTRLIDNLLLGEDSPPAEGA